MNIPIDIPGDQPRIYADELDATPPHGIERPAIQMSTFDFCTCDIPSPIPTDGGAFEECADCRKLLAT